MGWPTMSPVAKLLAVGRAAHGLQHKVVALRLGGGTALFCWCEDQEKQRVADFTATLAKKREQLAWL